MIRFASSVWFFLYFAPFSVIGFNHDALEHISTIMVLLGFPLGVCLVRSCSKNVHPYDYLERFAVSGRIIYVLFLVYMLANVGNILSITSALIHGELLSYSYGRVVERYDGAGPSKADLISRLGTISFLMIGSLLPYAEAKNKYILFILVFIMVGIESAGLARLGVLFLFTSFAIGYVIKNNTAISKMSLYKLAVIGCYLLTLLMVIFIFSAYFRVSHKDNVLEILFIKLLVYTIAMYDAFYIWFQAQPYVGNGFGFSTVAGVYKIIGHEVPQGFYTLSFTAYGPTNIYTNLRGLISDLGLVLSFLFFVFCGGLITTCAYKRMDCWSFILLHVTMFKFIFILISPYNYFNIFAAIILSGLIITGVRFGKLKIL